jgi:hypothetical protein
MLPSAAHDRYGVLAVSRAVRLLAVGPRAPAQGRLDTTAGYRHFLP